MRRPAAALVVALLGAVAVLPATADAAARLVVKGHGFGHGIGLSQYGALGYAQHGFGWRDILSKYYQQTSVAPLGSAPDVRVLLQTGRRVQVRGAVSVGGRKTSPAQTYTARIAAVAGRVALYAPSGRLLGTYAPPLRFTAVASNPLRLLGAAQNGTRNGRYRGALEVGLVEGDGARLQAVNDVGLEDYIRGVVSAESPASWPADALEAQAVVARSYAVTTNVGTTTDGIDQYSDTRSQMYTGIAAEFPSTDAAVAATAGQVVVDDGKPVTTFFFSTSGGHTENIEFSFLGAQPQPWLKGVDDPFDGISPKHTWGPITFTAAQAASRLKGLVRGSFRGITVLQRGTSPRIVRAEVAGTGGVMPVSGPELRRRFGLDDTWATFTYISSSARKQTANDDASATPPADHAGGTADATTGGATADSPTTPSAPTPAVATTGGQAAAARTPERVLAGTVNRDGSASAAHLRLQVARDGSWRTLRPVATAADGRYRVAVPGPGRYRVAWGDSAGPAVDVR
jgi:stage II sporulation protein D